jgi:hypothetical protein
MENPYHAESAASKRLRAIIEIRAGNVEISAVSGSDSETTEIFKALEKFLRGLGENSR